ncbi:MAG: hypothetical protein WDW38_011073 [Sanguina aurantia]
MEYNAAVRHYTSAIDKGPAAPLLFTKRAAAFISMRQQAQALKDLDSALQLDATFVQGFILRGKLLRQSCSLEAAEVDFQTVLKLRPGQKVALKEVDSTRLVAKLLGVLRSMPLTVGSADVVKEALRQLYEEAPDCLPALLVEMQVSTLHEDWDSVVALTGKVLKAQPHHLEAMVLRGRAYFYLNDMDTSKRHFGEALRFDPDCDAARKAFNRVKDFIKKKKRADDAIAEHKWAEAEGLYITALHVDNDHRLGNRELWFGLCRSRYQQSRYATAIEACNNVLILHAGHLDARLLVIKSLMGQELWQEAVTKAREAAGAERGNRDVHELLQDCERKLKISLRKDHYKTLGVHKDAANPEIKKAYRELAKRHHPDKVATSERKEAESRFMEIAEAYEVLSDSEKRHRYDNGQDEPQQQQHNPFQHGQQQFHFQWGH